jgi:hypothetical protein
MELSRVWFLLEPFDVEYKKYLILGALNKINSDWNVGKYVEGIQEISEYIKDLNLFVSDTKISDSSLSLLSETEAEIYTRYRRISKNGSSWDQIFEIIVECHYLFSEKIKEGIELWKEMGERVRVFSITPELRGHKKGILIMRNVETQDLDFYSWGCAKIQDNKMGVVMKKIHTGIMSYSLSYEYIISELITSLGIKSNKKPHVVIAEILGSGIVTDDILKMVKEKFTDFIIEDMETQNKR